MPVAGLWTSVALIIKTFLIGSFTSSLCVTVGYGGDPWEEGLQDIIYICDKWSVRMGGRFEQERENPKRLTLVANKQTKSFLI